MAIEIPPVPTLKSMVDGVHIPMGLEGSLFQNPAKEAFKALDASTKGAASLGKAMANADASLSKMITETGAGLVASSKGILNSLTAKVSALSTELPLALSAQSLKDKIQSVDAIVTGNLAGFPDLIQKAFPVPPLGKEDEGTPCPADLVESAMTPITESNDIVNKGNDAVAASFDENAENAPLYAALRNLIPPPPYPITDGKTLLKFLGDPGDWKEAVDKVLADYVKGDVLTSLVESFEKTQETTGTVDSTDPNNPVVTPGTLTEEYGEAEAKGAEAVKESMNTLTGANTVSMLENKSPCVANVMNKVVNPEMVNSNALTLERTVKDKTTKLPDQESIDAIKSTKPIDLNSPVNKPVVTATQIIKPNPGKPEIIPYSVEDRKKKLREPVDRQVEYVRSLANAGSIYYKDNVEVWKIANDFDRKKAAAGATKENSVGTSTDPVVLAEWKAVWDAYQPTLKLWQELHYIPHQEQSLLALKMNSESGDRILYGQYPYTYQASQGIIIPPDQQYDYLDPGKK